MTFRRFLFLAFTASALVSGQTRAQDTKTDPNADLDRQSKVIANETAGVALQKAQLDYETARANAKYALPNSGFTGSVSANQIGATAETNILYARLLPGLAQKVGDKIATACGNRVPVVLYSATDKRSRADLRSFELTSGRLGNEFSDAEQAFQSLNPPTLPKKAVSSTGVQTNTIPVLITAGMAALSLLKSDYTLGGSSITPADGQFINLIAARLKASSRPSVFASEYTPTQNADELSSSLSNLDHVASSISKDAKTTARWVAALKEAKASDAVVGPYEDAAAQLQAALADYQAWIKFLTTQDAAGDMPLVRANAQALLEAQNTCAAFIHVDSAAGSNYSNKNIATGLGVGMPFYVSAEATASYRVWNNDGSIADSGMFTADTAFNRLDKIHQAAVEDQQAAVKPGGH
jgi:hypothetical protein